MKNMLAILIAIVGVCFGLTASAQTITLHGGSGGNVFRDGAEEAYISWQWAGAPAGTTTEIRLVTPHNEFVGYGLTGTGLPSSGSVKWTPRVLHGQMEFWRVVVYWRDVAGNIVRSVQTGKLKIILAGPPRKVEITNPSDGRRIEAGSTVSIEWWTKNLPEGAFITLRLQVSEVGETFAIVPDTGSYSWQVPSLPPGQYILFVAWVNEYGVYSATDSVTVNIVAASTTRPNVVHLAGEVTDAE